MYDTAIKDRLLGYATSALLFADRGVAPAVVGINRVMLLHGPPGTGKTSLCEALAQKLAIRFSHRCRADPDPDPGPDPDPDLDFGHKQDVDDDADTNPQLGDGSVPTAHDLKHTDCMSLPGAVGRFRQALLIEVNAHSLFSKWFSESGKLVARLSAKIGEMVEDDDCLVFILIDEVRGHTAPAAAGH
jgi:DNA polymerase III delta prime subunit